MPPSRDDFRSFVSRLSLSNFSADELLHRVDAQGNSMPPEEVWGNVVPTILILDALRAELGAPVSITSAYRAPAYNRAVGGGERSQHQDFRALDFTCRTGTPDDWATLLRSWRGRPFPSPVELGLVSRHAPLSSQGARINRTAQGTAFAFAGGIGVYPQSNFVHLDCRGTNADWRGS